MADLPKLSYRAMQCLRILCENEGYPCTSTSINAGAGLSFRTVDGNGSKVGNELDRYHVKNTDLYKLDKLGFVVMVNKSAEPEEREDRSKFWAWYDRPFKLTQAGRNAFDDHYEAALNAEIEKRTLKDERFVIICGDHRYANFSERNKHNRRFCAFAKVTRETPARLYVQPILINNVEIGKGDELWRGEMPYYYAKIEGHNENYFVAKEDVTVDNATLEQYQRLFALETEKIEDRVRIAKDADDEIAPILARRKAREDQNMAMYEEMFDEVIKK